MRYQLVVLLCLDGEQLGSTVHFVLSVAHCVSSTALSEHLWWVKVAIAVILIVVGACFGHRYLRER